MGQDKALLDFHGVPQIEFVNDLLLHFCDKIFLSKRSDQNNYKRIASIDDSEEYANHGPLSGILSAMKSYPDVSWLVIACDLPNINANVIQNLLENRNPNAIATAYKSSIDVLPEPLCAVWEGHSYSSILALFNQGIHCPRKILIKSNVHLLNQKDIHWLDNVNTLEEYEQFNKHKMQGG